MEDQRPVNDSNRKTKKPASVRRPSLFRSRRRADRLPATELRAVQSAMEHRRNSEDVGREFLMPRPEVQDAAIIGLTANFRFLADQIAWVRRQMGIATTSTQGPFLLESGDRPNVRQFVQERRKSA